MKKLNTPVFFPEKTTLIISIFMILLSLNALAESDHPLYEKNFKTIEMQTRDHKKIKLDQLKSKTVLINFWASWCIPCLEEIPALIKLSEKHKESELSVVMINTDEENQLKMISKIEKKYKFPASFIVIPDDKFKIADQFKFSAIPVTVIYKNGKVSFFSNGPVDFSKTIIE